MAIVENFWLKGQKKKLGGSVIYQAMGQTRQRALATEVSNPRTASQMNQRVKWANLVNLYRANQSWMKYAFETKKTNQSDYNKWMSLNVSSSRIYLPKQLAAVGACVVDAYQITQGSLPSIEVLPSDQGWQTNIVLDASTIITNNTRVGEFSANLIRNNPAIREGDQLSFIRMTQQTNPTTGAPFVIVRKYELLVNSNSQILLSEYMPLDYIDSSEDDTDCRLIVKNSGAAGGFVLILSRTIAGRTYVSSQNIVVANNSTLINYYSSAAALQRAIDSYGESEDAFLTSTSANLAQGQEVINSILGIEIDGVTYAAGSRFVFPSTEVDSGIRVLLAYPLQAEFVPRLDIQYYKSGELRGSGLTMTIEDGEPYIDLITPLTEVTGGIVTSVTLTFGNLVYQAKFAISNEDTIEGLE